MSLFKVKTLWEPSPRVRGETFFHSALATVRSPLSPDPTSPLLATGSAGGAVRLYAPSGVSGSPKCVLFRLASRAMLCQCLIGLFLMVGMNLRY
jgi:hypothetical protein